MNIDMQEGVDHPSHYNSAKTLDEDGTAKYEPIKVIEDWNLGFCLGNAVKYILRAPFKGSEIKDLEKTMWYLDRNTEIYYFRDTAKREFTAREVAEDYDLPEHLELCLGFIRLKDSKQAAVQLLEYYRSMGFERC